MKSYFQTEAWGNFKAQTGWRYESVGEVLRLERNLPFGRRIYYFPELPFDLALSQRIRTASVAKNTIFSRFEFLEEYSPEKAAELKKIDLIKSFEEVQPEFRQWIDVSSSEPTILAQMKPKGRYNIGVARRHNLEIVHGGAELVGDFFKLYSFTAERTKFSGRNEAYLKQLTESLVSEKVGEIILVKKGEELLAGGIFLYFEDMASYLYGGSMGERKYMAPYLLHWEAMITAKKRGCKIYDLLAVAPQDEKGEPLPNHPYEGLTRFKTQFGGRTVQLLGSWDLVHSRNWYRMYKVLEQQRRAKNTRR